MLEVNLNNIIYIGDFEETVVCERMEWVLFRRSGKIFDRIKGIEDVGMGCME